MQITLEGPLSSSSHRFEVTTPKSPHLLAQHSRIQITGAFQHPGPRYKAVYAVISTRIDHGTQAHVSIRRCNDPVLFQATHRVFAVSVWLVALPRRRDGT